MQLNLELILPIVVLRTRFQRLFQVFVTLGVEDMGLREGTQWTLNLHWRRSFFLLRIEAFKRALLSAASNCVFRKF